MNFLELGKQIVKEMKGKYRDCFYRYVDENSLEDKTYIEIAKSLYDNEELFTDYMKHLVSEEFDWVQSPVNSFDFIHELVDVKLEESGKYYWDEDEECYVPISKSSELELNGRLHLYMALNENVWKTTEDDNTLENQLNGKKNNAEDIFYRCLNELIEENPSIIRKYGLSEIIIGDLLEVKVQ